MSLNKTIILFIAQKNVIQANKKSNKKVVFDNLQDERQEQGPEYKIGQLVRTADVKKVFSRGDSTVYSYNLYTKTEIIHDKIFNYRLNFSQAI